MKETKLYICEICNTQYADKLKARNCEESHKEAEAFVDAHYLPITVDASGMPNKIQVKFKDKTTAWYSR